MALLEPAACTLFLKGREEFGTTEFEEAIAPHFERLAPEHTLRRRHSLGSLIEELKQDGILVQTGTANEPRFIFLHLTFQEYLAAGHLARSAEPETTAYDAMTLTYVTKITPDWSAVASVVNAKAWQPGWQEVLVLFAGKLDDPKPLLKMMSDPQPTATNRFGDDYFRHRLALAALCLPEIRTDLRATCSALIDGITTAAFSLWWEHLNEEIHGCLPHATKVLPALGQVNGRIEGTPLLEWVLRRLGDGDPHVWWAAAQALGAIGARAATPEILARLTEWLGDGVWYVRQAAAQALGRMGAAAATPKVLARLSERLDDEDSLLREAAAQALGRMGAAPATPEALACFTERLGHGNWGVRRAAARALGAIGARAATPEILARLTTALGDESGHVRSAAARALGALGAGATTPEVLERLTPALGDEEEFVRSDVARALGQLGAGAATPEILERLTAALGDEEEFVRSDVARALGQLGAGAATPEILERLTAALGDQNLGVRAAVAEALGWLGASAATPTVVKRLTADLGDEAPAVRASAAEAFASFQSHGCRFFKHRFGRWEIKHVEELSRL